MNYHRFFLKPDSINQTKGFVAIKDSNIINQIKAVLRLKIDDQILVLDGEGGVFHCTISAITKENVMAKIIDSNNISVSSTLTIEVALPLLRGGRFEWALQKLTELGVSCAIPIISRHSVVKATDGSAKLARWTSIMREAAEQCERIDLPTIKEPIDLTKFFSEQISKNTLSANFICVERSKAPLLAEMLNSLKAKNRSPKNILLVIGPEGGFEPAEIDLANECGLIATSLGPRILRSETAAICALAQTRSIFKN